MWRAPVIFALLLAAFALVAPPQQARNSQSDQQKSASAQRAITPKLPDTQQREQAGQCPGSSKPNISCAAITADADIRQANAADQQVSLNWFQSIVGLFTVLAAAGAALFAKQAADAAQGALAHETSRTAAELRPWISIEVRATLFDLTEEYLMFDYEVVFKNIGKTIARHVVPQRAIGWYGGNIVGAAEWFALHKQPVIGEDDERALMPGEELALSQGYVDGIPPWTGSAPHRRVTLGIVATVFYQSPLDGKWHRTDRTFTVGKREGRQAAYVIYESLIGTMWTDEEVDKNLSYLPGPNSRTT